MYYEVLIASQKYHGDSTLTYLSADELPVRSVVLVPLQNRLVPGIITTKSSKPRFQTKPIHVSFGVQFPEALLSLVYWMKDYYPAPLGHIANLCIPSSLNGKTSVLEMVKTNDVVERLELPPLTSDQSKTISSILESTSKMHLIHGDTGTGKTRMYIELIRAAFSKNKSVILLTPEIGLTKPLIDKIEEVFVGQTVTLHSHLSAKQKQTQWLRAAQSQGPVIIIGPRSALFAPVHNVGFIIVDEAHDTAYKQEQSPRYVTTRVAGALGKFHDAKVVLGTATPLISDYYVFKQKGLPIYRITETAIDHAFDSKIEIVDLKDTQSFSRSATFSKQIIAGIQSALNSNSQSLVFLNRRGTARLIVCKACAWEAMCTHCDLPLTYHGDSHRMICHTCGFKATTPGTCPDCGEADILFKTAGTKALAAEISKLFPDARVARFDSDNKKSESLDAMHEHLQNGSIDIIVGTQMLVKGLDLPKLSFIGAVAADTALYFPDYTAEERTYQLLTQVIGRVNRGHRSGHVVVQTYQPENPAIAAALSKSYETFYESQITERETYEFPPFYFAMKIVVERKSDASAKTTINKIQKSLQNTPGLIISEPAPCFLHKRADSYRWQIIVKSTQRKLLTSLVAQLPKNCTYDIDPTDLL